MSFIPSPLALMKTSILLAYYSHTTRILLAIKVCKITTDIYNGYIQWTATLTPSICLARSFRSRFARRSCITIFFAAIGFLSPAYRGGIVMALLMFYVLMGGVAGYVTARLYKTFKGKVSRIISTKVTLYSLNFCGPSCGRGRRSSPRFCTPECSSPCSSCWTWLGEFHSVSARLDEDENTRVESREKWLQI